MEGISMKYHFKVGRAKNLVLDENDTFADLGFAVLDAYHIDSDHLFMFTFSNGDETNSVCPFGSMQDYRDVDADSPIKSRQMEVGEVMTMEYDYGSTWTRKVKLVEISDN